MCDSDEEIKKVGLNLNPNGAIINVFLVISFIYLLFLFNYVKLDVGLKCKKLYMVNVVSISLLITHKKTIHQKKKKKLKQNNFQFQLEIHLSFN